MTIPNFTEIPLVDRDVESMVNRHAERQRSGERHSWTTPEQIPVSAVYTQDDLEEVDHLATMPGFPPYVRGPYATMYVQRPWTVR